MKLMRILMVVLISLLAVPAFAQRPTDATMDAVRDAMQAEKRAFVAVNMQLNEEEEKAFWPIYYEYQKDLQTINSNLAALIGEYAKAYNTLTDEKAKELLNRMVSYEEDLTKLKQAYRNKFMEALGAKKTVRYYQLENKIQAVMRYDLAEKIPLVK